MVARTDAGAGVGAERNERSGQQSAWNAHCRCAAEARFHALHCTAIGFGSDHALTHTQTLHAAAGGRRRERGVWYEHTRSQQTEDVM